MYVKTVSVGILIACFAAGCGTSGSSSTAEKHRTDELPSPFTVVARYSPASLGLEHPRSFAIAPDGNLYITDNRQRVTAISPDGKILRRWGKPGSRPGEFRFVSDDPTDPTDKHGRIAVGPNGLLYVSDSGNARVQVFTPQGRFLRQFRSLGESFDLVVDPSGNVYVLVGQLVYKFSPRGKLIWWIGGPTSSDPDLAGHHHLASIDSHGRLVLLNEETAAVLYLDSNGHKLDSFDDTGGVFPPGTNPCEVTVDAAGNTYVTGCGRGGSCPEASCAGTLVFDRTHRPIAEWANPNVPLYTSPKFGPRGEVFALGQDGSLLRLHLTLPGD
jgi:DNA-binding beta-propeller fold protein YncE